MILENYIRKKGKERGKNITEIKKINIYYKCAIIHPREAKGKIKRRVVGPESLFLFPDALISLSFLERRGRIIKISTDSFSCFLF